MTGRVVFATNAATEGQIAVHLSLCDQMFVPALHDRVEIDRYAHKIWLHAERFEAWANGVLVGLVAAYCNDPERRVAYVTSVSVEPDYKGLGVASELMARCIERAANDGFDRIELEVDKGNAAAVKLYAKRGFAVSQTRGRTLVLSLRVESE